ncbi:hypothetical protein ACWEQL_01570 [Kitasatospora sp. NPDC004240]
MDPDIRRALVVALGLLTGGLLLCGLGGWGAVAAGERLWYTAGPLGTRLFQGALALGSLAVAATGGYLVLALARPVTRTARPENIAVGTAITLAGCALLALVAALISSGLGR